MEEHIDFERERIIELLKMINELGILRKIFYYTLDVMPGRKYEWQETDTERQNRIDAAQF